MKMSISKEINSMKFKPGDIIYTRDSFGNIIFITKCEKTDYTFIYLDIDHSQLEWNLPDRYLEMCGHLITDIFRDE